MQPPKFMNGTRVFMRREEHFFYGYVVCTYLDGCKRCVVKNSEGVVFIADENIWEQLSFPATERRIVYHPSKA